VVKHIGILALQGNFLQHAEMVSNLGETPVLIRYPEDLKKCRALIIPGGESPTMSMQIDRNGLRTPLKVFAETKPIMGTCAGMILLSSSENTKNMTPLRIMDFTVKRNGWGRQVHSFSDNLNLHFDKDKQFEGTFIRAPKISNIGKNINVLAEYNGEPVMLKNTIHLVCSFHPEVGHDYRIHQYFINNLNV